MTKIHLPQQLLLLIIEKIINKALALNLNSNHALHELSDKTLAIKLTELNFPIALTVNQQQVFVRGSEEYNDCLLTANIKALQALQQHQQLTELIKQDKLDITGDLKVAQRFASLFENITIDWRSELAKHLGDIPTYKLEQFSLWLAEKFNFAASQIEADATEWLVHEKQLAVTEHQLDDFSTQVDQLSQRLQQLEVRMTKLDRLLSNESALTKLSKAGPSGE